MLQQTRVLNATQSPKGNSLQRKESPKNSKPNFTLDTVREQETKKLEMVVERQQITTILCKLLSKCVQNTFN